MTAEDQVVITARAVAAVEAVERDDADRRRRRRAARASERGRGARPRRLARSVPAGRQRLAPDDEHDQDEDERDQLGDARARGTRCSVLCRNTASDWSMPMARPPITAGRQGGEPPEDRGGQRRHDEERVGAGDQRHERGDEDAGEAGDHGADRPVGDGDALRARAR